MKKWKTILEIETIIKRFYNAIDNHRFDELRNELFNNKVFIDLSQLTQDVPIELDSKVIVRTWKKSNYTYWLSHFHQVSNIVVKLNNNTAICEVHVKADHVSELAKKDEDNFWTTFSIFEIGLIKNKSNWKINHYKQNLKYERGNRDLVRRVLSKIDLENKF